MSIHYHVMNFVVLISVCICSVYGFLLNTTPKTSVTYSCNFETSQCGFTSTVASHGARWTRHLIGSGQPLTDHTYNTPRQGHVMHIASGSSGLANQSVNLTTSLFTGISRYQYASIGFWYMFQGTAQKSMRFNVYVNGATTSQNNPVYTVYESSNTPWRHVCASVHVLTNLAVTFEIVLSHSGSTGEFAIDDVTVESGLHCSSTSPLYVTTTKSSLCREALSHACGVPCSNYFSVLQPASTQSVTCDFEHANICGYQATNVPGDTFDWIRHQGSTLSSATGPSGDHTSTHGYYMYIETSSPRQPGDNARLVSPKFVPHGQQHVTFWYHAYGKSIGSLKVYAEHLGRLGNPLFQYSGPGSNQWKHGCLDIPISSGDTSIVFEGIRGDSYYGDIAIDDVRLEAGTCSSGPVVTTTTTTHTLPVDGWSDWTTWSACSTSCDLGLISRSRSCTQAIPTTGGNKCNGTTIETHECSLGTCPEWSAWFDGKCSSSCGNGTVERMRSCSTGNNADCGGYSRDFIPCVGIECIR